MVKSPMPKWKPAPPELTSLFADALERLPAAEARKMFGSLAGFTGGNMFAGIFQDSIILRLSESDRAAFAIKVGGQPFEPMPGRVMREYVVAPPVLLKQPAKLKSWLEKALDFAASLPPKASKKPKSSKKLRP